MNKLATIFRESSIARILIPLGIILTIFGIVSFIINAHNSDYIPIDAVVSKTELAQEAYTDTDGNYVEATYKVYVKYTVKGKETRQEMYGDR